MSNLCLPTGSRVLYDLCNVPVVLLLLLLLLLLCFPPA